MTKFFAFLALISCAWIAGAWMFMLGVGIVHAEWIPALPTISYRLALLLNALLMGRFFVGAIFGAMAKAVGGDGK